MHFFSLSLVKIAKNMCKTQFIGLCRVSFDGTVLQMILLVFMMTLSVGLRRIALLKGI